MKILLTSTSFQDTPGKHQEMLEKKFTDVDFLRGPLKEDDLLPVIDKYDGIIMGDDEYTQKVLEKGAKCKLKVLSKYGVGLDKVNLDAAAKLGISVRNVEGVNQKTVAEHVYALLLSYAKNIPSQLRETSNGRWYRKTGFELRGKKLGILGFGKIGKEVAKLGNAFGMDMFTYDISVDLDFAKYNNVEVLDSIDELFRRVDILTLHMPLTEATKSIVNKDLLSLTKTGFILVNTARGALVDEDQLRTFLVKRPESAYLTDVLVTEPIGPDCSVRELPNVWITPHIGSRTLQNVERQGLMAIKNLASELGLAIED